ncbi:MAG TPA: hypothetical protein VFE96_10005 [Candidatus Bathyarchaeia archaeon]|nr:hypothetical protein [Candidatus Bathyarchaeia archaeon]
MPITADDLILGVVSALIGLAVTLPVTYLVVDRIVDSNEKKKLVPVEKLAKERLRSKLGVGFLTTFLITLVIDVTSASRERSPIPKDVLLLHIEKLKTAQSDLETLLGVYSNVLDVNVARMTSDVILQIEHLQEDFEYLAETEPRPPTESHASHMEQVLLKTVHFTKEELVALGADNLQIRALEDWLGQYTRERRPVSRKEEPLTVRGGHTI